MARTDALTGLKNRRAFDEEVQMEIRRAVRHGTALTLVMADIDHFKRINDNFGHQFGDLVLAHFSRIISMSIRTIDVPGRWGGEEFVILMPDTGLEEACQVAERIRMTFEQSPLKRGGDDCVVTASFGLAQLSAKEPTLDFLLSRADTALYRAKEDGRNRLVKG
jgi:diguanylate cyclase (GGDEF)-like protein